MEFDTFLEDGLPGGAGATAADAEHLGFGGLWAGEAGHDPFLPLAAAVSATHALQLGTAIAVAFARSPMTVAHQAWDLAHASRGRFVLGLGTQVRAHITRRYSMTWSSPQPRMEEYIHALRAIFDTFQNGSRLEFEGEHYRHTLMAPFFNPGPIEWPAVPIALAAVGEKMTHLAGRLCDGIFLHPFTNTTYQDKVTFPHLHRGLAQEGRVPSALWVFGYVFLVVGDTKEQQAISEQRVRERLAFYASTPSYREVLASIGYEDLQAELHAMVKAERWDDLPRALDDEFLDHFVVRGTLEEIPGRLQERYGDRYDRVASYFPLPAADPDRISDFVTAVRG